MYENAVPVPRIFVALAYRMYSSSGYGYECRAELAEVLGTVNTLGNYTASRVEFGLI